MFFILGNYVFSGEYPQINYVCRSIAIQRMSLTSIPWQIISSEEYTLLIMSVAEFNNIFDGVYLGHNVCSGVYLIVISLQLCMWRSLPG